MQARIAILAAAVTLAASAYAQTAEEFRQLGNTLTPIGAEKAGNKEGTIPAYTGGNTQLPEGYKKGSGVYLDPFAEEKPRLSIDAKNMEAQADKLTEGTKALLKRYPSFRVDVYPTHRTVWFNKSVLDATMGKAGKAQTSNGGLSLDGVWAQYPFPIPKDGSQVMWNHLTRMPGTSSYQIRAEAYNVDASGTRTLSSGQLCDWGKPYWDDKPQDVAATARCFYFAPARRAGEALMALDPLDFSRDTRKAYQYLPGQRRVRLAPDLAFDTPNPGTAGVQTYDDIGMFNGSLERYNWKLVGKKEVIVPYNAYKATFGSTPDELFGAKHLNPDRVRWELHRAWVVEADLKEGQRHVYKKRRFYVDEDSWAILATETYDARDQLYKVGYSLQSPSYEFGGTFSEATVFYDLVAGNYANNFVPFTTGYVRHTKPLPAREWTGDALAGAGIR